MTTDIGLVIWGCKGGCRTFCDNRVVNVDEPVIRQTLKDIRTFILFKQSGLDYYAVEFTPQYKVYTHYRSSNDSGSGAFIAFTVYVPHNKRINHIREILDEMMADYFREYMNPMSNTPLPGKYDDINRYTNILARHESDILPDTRRYRALASRQDDTPQIFKYDDPAKVDEMFDNPYHKEFFECQEVMFLRSEYYDRRADFNIDFVVEPRLITTVTPSEKMSMLLPPDESKTGGRLTRLVINGADYSANPADAVADENSIVDLTFERERYKPFAVSGQPLSALMTRGIIRKEGRDYAFGKIPFEPEIYRLNVMTARWSKLDLKDFAIRLWISAGGGHKPVKKEGNDYYFELEGPEIDRECQLAFLLSSDLGGSVTLDYIKPVDYVSSGKPLEVGAGVYVARIEFKDTDTDSVNAGITFMQPGGKEANVTVAYKSEQQLALPQTADRCSTVSLSLPDAKITQDMSGVFVVTPDKVKVRVFIPNAIKPVFDKWAAKVQLGKNQESYSVNDNGYVNLPYGWEYIGEPVLVFKKGESVRTVPLQKDKDGRLCFNVVVVENKTAKPVTVIVGGKPYEVATKIVLHENPASTVSLAEGTGLNIEKTDSGETFALWVISSNKEQHTSDKLKVNGGDSPKDKTGNEKLPFGGKGLITFKECGKYMTMLQFQGQTEPTLQQIPSNKQEVRVRMTQYVLYALDGVTRVLHLDLNDPRHHYRSGDFEVYKTAHTEWTVKYKPSFTSKIIDFFTSKLGLGLIVLLVILGGGAWAYFALFSNQERTLYVTVDNVEPVNGIEIVKPGALNMRSSGNTLTITFKGDTLEFAGNEVVRIDFGPEGKTDGIRVMELVGKTDYVFENNMDSVKVTTVQTPAYELYAKIIEVEPIDTAKVEAFRNMYAESKYNQDLAEKVTAQKAAEADAEAKAAQLAQVKAQYNALIAKLGNMNVTKADLDKVIRFQNEHKEELNAEIKANWAKVNAYKNFFDPAQSFFNNIKQFSPAQQQACIYYQNFKGNDPKRDFNYALKKAKEMGLI